MKRCDHITEFAFGFVREDLSFFAFSHCFLAFLTHGQYSWPPKARTSAFTAGCVQTTGLTFNSSASFP